MRVRTKICGITHPEDAQMAVEAGADALGFMFHPASPRFISSAGAAEIIRGLPPFVSAVGVFVDLAEAEVREITDASGIDTLQFHGAESPEYCARFIPRRVFKAFRMRGLESVEELPRFRTAAWLLDSFVPGVPGGTGTQFNWALAAGASKLGVPIILAGGLTPENVGEAIRQARPYAVDVSSGVESRPGRKDPGKVRAFIQAVQAASLD